VFIDKDTKALSHLKHVLHERGYGDEVGRSIHLICDDFVSASSSVLQLVGLHTPRAKYGALLS
jgi:hypothetical protein